MSKVFLAICVAAGLYWYFVDSRVLSKSNIEGFYARMDVSMTEMNADELCKMLTPDYESVLTYMEDGKIKELHQDREDSCDAFDKMKETQRALRKVGRSQISYGREIYGFDLSKDKRVATVDLRYGMDIGGLIGMHVIGTDTLVRKNGVVMIKRSESRSAAGVPQ